MSYIVQKAIEPDDLSDKQAARFARNLSNYQLQPKIDGCHAVFLYGPGSGEPRVLSSTGEPVRSCDHLWYELQPDVPGQQVAVLAEVALIDCAFKDSSGAFRRHAAQPDLRAHVFDLVYWREEPGSPVILYSDLPYRTRHGLMGHLGLQPLPLFGIGLYVDISAGWKRDGFRGCECDGGVLRDMTAPYKAKRCRDGEVIKVKPLLDFDLAVIGVDLAYGEKTGKNTAALVCRFAEGVHLRVATGLTQAEVDALHQTHGDSMIGKIIRVEALGHSGTGSLREPRFVGVRTDKITPDF